MRSRMGSDQLPCKETVCICGFNSRSRMGSDIEGKAPDLDWQVSIRAPAWGATFRFLCHRCSSAGFNSRSRMGSDMRHGYARGCARGFNSRSRMGSDALLPGMDKPADVFQFALPHGERLPSCNGRYSLHRKRTIR